MIRPGERGGRTGRLARAPRKTPPMGAPDRAPPWGRLCRSSERPKGSVLVHFSARKVDSGRKYRNPSLECFTCHTTLLAIMRQSWSIQNNPSK